jgi:serine/threonine protein kinase/dipeptidyl aminopeptidase/acylaminoacyl peptidase
MDDPGLVGQTVLHYRITEKIGEGGMGTVYKAVDTHLDRPVAIKVLPPGKVADPERRGRFVQEAKAASALRHPNIVVIHDIASDRGIDFMVMELVEGQSLDEIVGRRGLKLNEALGFAVQIADGLAKAHAAGIVHRDLKPTNVMVTADGLVKILDFGLAKLTEDIPAAGFGATMTLDAGGRPRTEEGYILGTAAYMSPEQAEGKRIDARSDIFSFGAVLYEMFTGHRAFDRGSRIKTLAAVLNEEPKPASAVTEAIPAEVERILARCLRKDPQRRWQTMSDLKVALQDLKEDSESGRLEAASIPARRGRKKTALFALAVAVLLVVVAILVLKFVVFKPSRAVEYEILPLTLDPGLSCQPTLSPDGNLMAYVSDREGKGNLDIWVQQVSGGSPLRLTNNPADDWFPSFSPDGSQIAFRSDRDGGGIYLIDALAVGGEPRRIADKGFIPKFSPDGRWISFMVLPASLESRHYRTYVVPSKGGEPRRILDDFLFGFIEQGAAPVWSPDSKNLLFQARRADDPKTRDWWLAPVDGGEPVRTHAIENLGLTTIVQYPVGWAGNNIYFVSGTTIEGINLFRASIAPKIGTVRGPAEAITTGPGMKLFPTVMPDGRIFYSDMTVAMNAWSVAGRTNDGEVSGDPRKLTRDVMQNFNPSVSRDGSRAVFTAFGGAQTAKYELRLVDLRTGEEAKIPLQGRSIWEFPRLSPDGSLLAYRDIIEGITKTFIVAPGAAAARPLCENCSILGFFPDNEFALVQIIRSELEKRNLRTGETSVVLASPSDFVSDSSVSPDGNWIAWLAALPDGRAAIRITPVEAPPAGAERTITVAEADYFLGNPDWSPNGRWLYYLSEKNGRASIFAREVDPRTKRPAGAEREVFLSTESGLNLNYPKGHGTIGVAADRIIFEGCTMTGNIYLARPKKR